MTSAHATTPPDRRIALLIDADNVSHGKIAEMLAELSKHGTANIRRACGDWADRARSANCEEAHGHGADGRGEASKAAAKPGCQARRSPARGG